MTNEKFKEIYKKYSEYHVYSNEKSKNNIVSYYNDSGVTLLSIFTYIIIVISLLITMRISLDYSFIHFYKEKALDTPETKTVFTIIFFILTFSCFYVTTKINMKIIFFFGRLMSKNLRQELQMRDFVYTGDLNLIFDKKLFYIEKALKNNKELLINDVTNFKGIKGDTILKIFHNSNAEKIDFLFKNRNIIFEKLEITESSKKMIEFFELLTIDHEKAILEERIEFHHKYIKTVNDNIYNFQQKEPEYRNSMTGIKEKADYDKRLKQTQYELSVEEDRLNYILTLKENEGI